MPAAAGMPDAEALRAAAPRLPAGARYRVCFSGGGDSTALLHLMVRSGLAPLQALHVDHGLQAQSALWSRHCASVCEALGVPLQSLAVTVDPNHPQGPEAAARAARYDALRAAMQPDDVLVLAHHLDDQAETVLMRLLRGTGVDGLGAMRAEAPFAPGRLWRPLLQVPRARLRTYLGQHGLDFIDDPHNVDRRYTRVWLRHDILPALAQRQPALPQALARLAAHARDQSALLQELADIDLHGLIHDDALRVQGLLSLSAARRRNALRHWLRCGGFERPDADTMDRIEREVLGAAADAVPRLCFGAAELRRYRDHLYVMPRLPPAPAADTWLWWTSTPAVALPPGCGGLEASQPPPQSLKVRFARDGERLRPAGSSHSRSLKNLFQEAGIPPWQRRRRPLIELEGEAVWIPGLPEAAAWRDLCASHDWHPRYRAQIDAGRGDPAARPPGPA